MILGPVLNFECPRCKNIMSKKSLISGNNFGAKGYSDGKEIAPMLPKFPVITKCSDCGALFWLNAETKTDKKPENNIHWAQFLTIDELFLALDQDENKTWKRERILRRKIWWAYNDRVRNGEKIFLNDQDKKRWYKNINELIHLINPDNINEKIALAELYRHIGEFKKSEEIINSLDNKYEWLKSVFNKQIREKNTLVFQLV